MFELEDDMKKCLAMGGFVGLAQINPMAGNLESNSNKIIEFIKQAESLNLDIVAFPKNALLGFEIPDFIDRYPFILEEIEKWLTKIAESVQKTAVLLGFINKNKKQAYAILRNRKIDKILEDREFITSKEFHDGVEFLIKPIAIPSRAGSQFILEQDLKKLAKKVKRPVLQINQVGAIDGWSYAGQSCVCDEDGNIFARAKDFEEQLLVVNPFRKIGKIYSSEPKQAPSEFTLDYEWDLERTYKSVVQAVRDYFNKCGLKRAVLGLSGGLDSTVCSVILVDALGKENVFGV